MATSAPGRPETPGPNEFGGSWPGQFKLIAKLGEGGYGVVYAADQEEPVRRRVALKVIKPGMDSVAIVRRFEAESQALAMMDHPNIAKVFEAGVTDAGRSYFVMELVIGLRITEHCDNNQISLRDRIELFILVCEAVQHAHQKGIIHRDLKPSNILVSVREGAAIPKVIDFGIAKATGEQLSEGTLVTQWNQLLGTPAYMSPEQAEGNSRNIDTRSDIYSLGALLYELLVGSPPFATETLVRDGIDALRRRIREVDPHRPSARLGTLEVTALEAVAAARATGARDLRSKLRGDLDAIVMKCLEKDRSRRYETANALVLDLRRHLEDQPVRARAPSARDRFLKFARRHKAALAVAALMVAMLVSATGISTWQAMRAYRAEASAKAYLGESEKAHQEAEAVAKSLMELIQSPSPDQDGPTVTIAEALGRTAKKIETCLAAYPARRVELQAALGATCRALGFHRDALELRKKVCDYYSAALGPEHPDTLDAKRDLAISCLDASRIDDAIKLCEEVLAARRKLNGPSHPKTLLAMSQLAWACSSVQLGKAIELEEQVLPLSRQVCGPEHPDTVQAMSNLGWFYNLAMRNEPALQMQTEAVALWLKSHSREHPRSINLLTLLAIAQDRAGHREEAILLQQELIALSRKVKGPDHPEILWVMGNLADSYLAAGRVDEAVQGYEEVLAISRRVNGPEHGRTQWALKKLADIYDQKERHTEARKLREELASSERAQRAPKSPDQP